MYHKTQLQRKKVHAFISAFLSLIFLVGCVPSGNNEPFSPLLLAEWDVGKEYYITWNSNSKMFLVYSHLNENELNNVQAFDVEKLEKIWGAKNKFPVTSVFTRDGLQIIEVDSVDNTIKIRDAKQGDVIRDQNKNCDVGQFILPSFDDKAFLMANQIGTVGLNVSPEFYVNLFEMNTGECKALFRAAGFLTLFDVNSIGNLIATGADTIRIW